MNKQKKYLKFLKFLFTLCSVDPYLVHEIEHMWANTEFTAYILKDG